VLGLFLLITVINFISAPMLKKSIPLQASPLVSVLVPVRNEEMTIEKCIAGLQNQNYTDLEILIYDDQSTDKSVEIVKKIADHDSRIKLIAGIELPKGWTGKNHACYQLSLHANGKILIFTDADNFYSPHAVRNTVAWMQKYNLQFLSAFPRQITDSWSEKLVVPIYDFFVYSMLPLWLTYSSPFPSLSAANGQWLAMTRTLYDQNGHKDVKSHIVEDTILARRAKKLGFKTLTSSGQGIVFGKMYHSWQQVLDGFTKNTFGLMEYKLGVFLFFQLMIITAFILPFIALFVPVMFYHMLIPILMIFIIRSLLVIKFGHPFVETVLLAPLGMVLFVRISINSVLRFYKRNVEWKGRNAVVD